MANSNLPLLIDEWTNVRVDLLEESTGATKIVAKGEFAFSDVPTANKRVYRRSLWEREVKRKQNSIVGNKVYGELDHPADGKTKLGRSSHIVTKLEVKSNGQVYGEASVLDTSQGKELKAILKGGGQVGVSSRGFGTTRPDSSGNDIVQEDYQLVTFDFVADPAVATSYPTFETQAQASDTQMEVSEPPGAGVPLTETGEIMTLEELKKAYPELVAQVKKEASDEAGHKAAGETDQKINSMKEDLQKDFETKLVEVVSKMKAEARTEVKGELLSDPSVAGAKVALEDISKIVLPYFIPEDIAELVNERDEQIKKLEAQINEEKETAKNLIQEMTVSRDEYKDIAKRLGFILCVEQELEGNSDVEAIRASLGDIMRFENVDELKTAVREAKKLFEKQKEEEEQRNEEVKKLQDENTKLRESLQQAMAIGHGLGIRLYMEEKVGSHPHRMKICKYIESAKPASKEEVNQLIEAYEKENPLSEEYERIQASLRAGRENRGSDSAEIAVQPLDENANVAGVSMGEIVRIAGVGEQSN